MKKPTTIDISCKKIKPTKMKLLPESLILWLEDRRIRALAKSVVSLGVIDELL